MVSRIQKGINYENSGIINLLDSLVIIQCYFWNCSNVDSDGGCIYSVVEIAVEYCVFFNSYAKRGGAIFTKSVVDMHFCIFDRVFANVGGSLYSISSIIVSYSDSSINFAESDKFSAMYIRENGKTGIFSTNISHCNSDDKGMISLSIVDNIDFLFNILYNVSANNDLDGIFVDLCGNFYMMGCIFQHFGSETGKSNRVGALYCHSDKLRGSFSECIFHDIHSNVIIDLFCVYQIYIIKSTFSLNKESSVQYSNQDDAIFINCTFNINKYSEIIPQTQIFNYSTDRIIIPNRNNNIQTFFSSGILGIIVSIIFFFLFSKGKNKYSIWN